MKRSKILAAAVLATVLALALPVSAAEQYPVFDVEIVYMTPEGDAESAGNAAFVEIPELPYDEEGFVIGYKGNRDYFGRRTEQEQPQDWPESSEAEELREPEEPEPVDTSAYAEEVLRLVNVEREKAGLTPLATDPVLSEMAQVRTEELKQGFSHTRPNGTKCSTIFEEYETSLKFDGENIALSHTPARVVAAWMNSKGHRANILREDARYLGVGVATGGDNGWLYWTQGLQSSSPITITGLGAASFEAALF